MRKHGIELVCFDLNKTLINETTWDDLNVAMGMTREQDQDYLQQFNAGKFTYRQRTKMLLDIYLKQGLANLPAIMTSISHYNYKEGAVDLVQYLRQQGYHLALISGAMDLLVDKVAAELNIKMAEANNIFIFDANDDLRDIETFDEDNLAKLRHLESFCRKLKLDLTQCVCVGDGDNDITLFEKTRHGITFTGSKIASSAWKVVNNLTEIKTIL